jgi:fructose-1,6-bisphosphatase
MQLVLSLVFGPISNYISNSNSLMLFRDLNGVTGKEMVGAALACYGSRTTLIIYNTVKNHLEEWTIRENESGVEHWEKTREKMRVSKSTKFFSCANSRAILDNLAYRQALEFWTRSGYSLRYSGAFSADVYHLLTKG